MASKMAPRSLGTETSKQAWQSGCRHADFRRMGSDGRPHQRSAGLHGSPSRCNSWSTQMVLQLDQFLPNQMRQFRTRRPLLGPDSRQSRRITTTIRPSSNCYWQIAIRAPSTLLAWQIAIRVPSTLKLHSTNCDSGALGSLYLFVVVDGSHRLAALLQLCLTAIDMQIAAALAF